MEKKAHYTGREFEFTPIKPVLRYESIVDQIMGLVDSGALRIGDKFPTERILADRWNVSRPSLREAFRVLESRGIVESRHGAGRFLRSDKPRFVPPGPREQLKLTKAAIIQMWDVRSILEVRAAELAAVNATEADIQAIFRPIEMIKSMPADESVASDLNIEIHTAIAQASHNHYLEKMIRESLTHYQDLDFKESVPLEEWKRFQDEHRPVAEAIRARSPIKARREMEVHFEALRNDLERWTENS